jgi:hypothetical protein
MRVGPQDGIRDPIKRKRTELSRPWRNSEKVVVHEPGSFHLELS